MVPTSAFVGGNSTGMRGTRRDYSHSCLTLGLGLAINKRTNEPHQALLLRAQARCPQEVEEIGIGNGAARRLICPMAHYDALGDPHQSPAVSVAAFIDISAVDHGYGLSQAWNG